MVFHIYSLFLFYSVVTIKSEFYHVSSDCYFYRLINTIPFLLYTQRIAYLVDCSLLSFSINNFYLLANSEINTMLIKKKSNSMKKKNAFFIYLLFPSSSPKNKPTFCMNYHFYLIISSL